MLQRYLFHRFCASIFFKSTEKLNDPAKKVVYRMQMKLFSDISSVTLKNIRQRESDKKRSLLNGRSNKCAFFVALFNIRSSVVSCSELKKTREEAAINNLLHEKELA